MPLSADWDAKIITIPVSEMTLVTGTRYKLTVAYWWVLLRELNGSDQGVVDTVNAPLFQNTSPTTTTPRIVEVINGWQVAYESGTYSLEFTDGNTNIREVEITNPGVSVGTNNTSALINPTVLEAGVFGGRVVVDILYGVGGTGKTPTGDIIGTFRAPSNNITDAISIAVGQGIKELFFNGDAVINEDLSAEYKIVGDSPFNVLTANPIADLTGCAIENMTVSGELDGLNILQGCRINNITGVSGAAYNCAVKSGVEVTGDFEMVGCYSSTEGSLFAEITHVSGNMIVRDYHGSLKISNVANGTHSIGIENGGRAIVGSDCTGGEVHLRGSPFDIVDDSQVGCIVYDETESSKVREMYARLNLDNTIDMTHHVDGRITSSDNSITVNVADDGNGGKITSRT